MKLVSPTFQGIINGVRSIFMNPFHYTYVLQKIDGHVYLYDQMTMRQVGKTKLALAEDIKMIAFTENFNYFFSYIEIKPYASSSTGHLLVFSLQEEDKINYKRYLIKVDGIAARVMIKYISYFQSFRLDGQDCEVIIGLSQKSFNFINIKGEIIKQMSVQNLNIINGMYFMEQDWLLYSKNELMWCDLAIQGIGIRKRLGIVSQIAQVFVDSSQKKQFLGVLSISSIIFIVARFQQDWSVCFNFTIPFISINRLCFLYAGIDTSNLNKFKDKLFLVFDGALKQKTLPLQSNIWKQDQKTSINQILIAKRYISSKFTYILEYSLSEVREKHSQIVIKPKQKYYFANNCEQRRLIWTNCHQLNSIVVLDGDKKVKVINLICLLSGEYVGVQWVSLGFRFEGSKNNLQFEQRQSQYEHSQRKEVTKRYLQDWSYSLFSRKQLIKKSIIRLNSLLF